MCFTRFGFQCNLHARTSRVANPKYKLSSNDVDKNSYILRYVIFDDTAKQSINNINAISTMFSLRNSSSGSSSSSDEDSFGWWIGVETQATPAKSPSCSSGTSEDVSGDRAVARDLASSAEPQQQLTGDDAEDIEMRLLDVSEKPDDAHRRALCYTPERLIRSEDYRIVAPPPRFCPGLSTPRSLSPSFQDGDSSWTTKTTEDRMIGAKHLAALLRSSHRTSSSATTSCRRCCCIWYGDGEVLLHTERCPRTDEEADRPNGPVNLHIRLPSDVENDSCCEDSRRFSDDCCSREGDQKSDITDDSSRVSPVDRDTGLPFNYRSHTNNVFEEENESNEKQQRQIFHKLKHVPREKVFAVCQKQIKIKPNMNEVGSTLENLNNDPTSTNTFPLDDDRFRDTYHQHSDNCLTKLVLTIQPDGKFARTKLNDPELELELLRGKLEKIQGSNKDLYEEITLLRRDFMKDEWKVNNLSEDIGKLRNEVYELRYMDDLLKLLKGELERISNRNWPFAIGHTQNETEEINLVI